MIKLLNKISIFTKSPLTSNIALQCASASSNSTLPQYSTNNTDASTNKQSEESAQQQQEQKPKKPIFHADPEEEAKEEEEKTEGEEGEQPKRQKNRSVYFKVVVYGSLLAVTGYSAYNFYEAYAKYEGTPLQRMQGMYDEWNKPISTKLLPDRDENDAEHAKPVLVLNVDNLLIYLNWTQEKGWQAQKRPHLDRFLQDLSHDFEIVLFSDSYLNMMMPVAQKIDPQGVQTVKLFKDHASYINRKYVKDLNNLNRPLSKIIIIDHNKDAVSKQPENALVIAPWKGDTRDVQLMRLEKFLKILHPYIKKPNADVRTILKNYGNTEKSGEEVLDEFYNLLLKQQQQQQQLLQQQQQLLAQQKSVESAATTTNKKKGWFGLF